ncbi:cytochrome c biogenesis protein CcsA [Thermocrinis jamiesonii]|uniref:cytochrome c biogenesis protein CcsA n=1 Tax=Thermocrinis jamiesonii TaxID=1302351 RepID=UPI00049805C1|nr:cytochrome c biogenesis protein CcsA [Thermocrinis jamiesonii]
MLFLALFLYLVSSFFGIYNLITSKFHRFLANGFMGLALICYFIYFALRYLDQNTFPFGDIYGFFSLLGNLLVLAFILLSYKYSKLLYFSYMVAFIGFLSTLFALPSSPSPYKSTLYGLHLLSASLSYLFAFLGGMSSSLKLLIERRLKTHTLFQAYVPLNSLITAERLFTNLTFLGFTITLVFGSFWTRSQFGKHWIDDPKLLITLLLWIYYAILSHLNLLKKLKPKRFSEGVMIGTLLSIINLLFVRHSI